MNTTSRLHRQALTIRRVNGRTVHNAVQLDFGYRRSHSLARKPLTGLGQSLGRRDRSGAHITPEPSPATPTGGRAESAIARTARGIIMRG